jgi:hypothetical protein
VSDILEQTRRHCRKAAKSLIELRKKCHLNPEPHSDGCGYYRDKYSYLQVDCRIVKAKPLCWISIIDHYTGEILFSKPCKSTPEAAQYGRTYFTRKNSRA